ncbi:MULTISPECIES: AraC family transcriptional regulator [Rhizobium/Agrobacterium group]|nr:MULTISPECIES: AraC family transcriptional regulator [Rhizobium/Agrobacterium group]MCZ7487903.1 AraC family transcriptional regulator [Rhizobium rhizogenes]
MNARVECGQMSSAEFVDDPLRSTVECDTAGVSALERFEFFRNWHSDIIDVGLAEGETATFEASEKIWQIADIAFAVIDTSPGHLLRWEHKKKPAVDNWVVTVRNSEASGPKDGSPRRRLRMANLAAPGDFESKGRLIALFFPYGAVDAPLHPEIAENAVEFLADYLILLHQNLVHLKQSSVSRVAEATTHMLAAVLLPSHEKLVQAQAPIDAVVTTRAIRAIGVQIADPDLSPEHLCKSVGVSRSRLYRIFEPAGGISNYIRRKRLLETYRALADTTNVNSISQIAENVGFTDPSSYSRMFKREFGLSPKEVRALGWQGIRHPLAFSCNHMDTGAATLNTLLISNALGLSDASA